MPLSTNAKLGIAVAAGFLAFFGAVMLGFLLSPNLSSLVAKEAAKTHGGSLEPKRTTQPESGPTNLTILRPVEFRRSEFVTNR